jgi:hypothetical protein
MFKVRPTSALLAWFNLSLARAVSCPAMSPPVPAPTCTEPFLPRTMCHLAMTLVPMASMSPAWPTLLPSGVRGVDGSLE